MNRDLFKQWLINQNRWNSAVVSDILSRCSRVEKCFITELDSSNIDEFIEYDDDNFIEELNITGEGKKASIASIKTGLRICKMFLLDSPSVFTAAAKTPKLPKDVYFTHDIDNKFRTFYSKKDLIQIFLNRLNTQDRLYKDLDLVYWPRLFKRYAWFEELLIQSIDEIYCYIEKEDLQFKDIEGFVFRYDSLKNELLLYYMINGVEVLAHERANNNTEKHPFRVKISKGVFSPVSRVTLDHVVPLVIYFNNNHERYPQLKALFNYLKENDLLRIKELSKSTTINSIMPKVTENTLKSEVTNVIRSLQLQFMEYSKNSSKGGK